jgi:RNA polymerase sigma factor (sigma-70 family)
VEEDEELMTAIAAGDGAALAALMARWQHRLLSFLWRRSGGRDVEDLFQETWLRIVRGAAGFDPRRRFSTWMFQVALNVARDAFARRPPEAPEAAALAEVVAPAVGPARDAALTVESLLATLPPDHREVVELRYLAELSEAETAEVLAIARGTVKSRLHHALRKMAAAAKGDEEGRQSGQSDG